MSNKTGDEHGVLSIDGEIWQYAKGFPGYLTSNKGRVYSSSTGQILTEGIVMKAIKDSQKDSCEADIATEIDEIKKAIHYPECWDTIAYPSLFDAIMEIYEGCHDCENSTCTSNCGHGTK